MQTSVFSRLVLEFIGDFFYFPIWWYTTGIARFMFAGKNIFAEANLSLAPGLWLKNLFVPMFGQTDWQGRIMSVFMRIVNVFFRSLALILVLIFLLFLGVVWLLIIPFCVTMLFFVRL